MQSTSITDLQIAEIQDRLNFSHYEAWHAVGTFNEGLDSWSGPWGHCSTRQLRRDLAFGFDSDSDWGRVLAVANIRVNQRERACLSLAAAHGCDLPPSTRGTGPALDPNP
jgi:hypothetical protein